MLLAGDPRKDKAAAFYNPLLTELWSYSAANIDIADNLVSIDRAMRAGFNWELGPFEMQDACGLYECRSFKRRFRVVAGRSDGTGLHGVDEQAFELRTLHLV